MSGVVLEEQAAPSTPSSNKIILYPKADGLLYWKDDTGAERAIYTLPTLFSNFSSHIQGLIISNNAIDATNDIDISIGSCIDPTAADFMSLSSVLTKRLDANFVEGTNQGGLDTGAIADNEYFVWLIKRPDTGVVDVLFSLSNSAPTMPANYTLKRLIGWIKRLGALILPIKVVETSGGGILYLWSSPTLDINLAATLTTSRRLDAVKVPDGLNVKALLNVNIVDAAAGSLVYIYSPDGTDLAPSATVAPLATIINYVVAVPVQTQVQVMTNTSKQIAARASVATIDNYRAVTLGFEWSRR